MSTAAALHEEAMSVYREMGHKKGVSASLRALGFGAYEQGDYERAVCHIYPPVLRTGRRPLYEPPRVYEIASIDPNPTLTRTHAPELR